MRVCICYIYIYCRLNAILFLRSSTFFFHCLFSVFYRGTFSNNNNNDDDDDDDEDIQYDYFNYKAKNPIRLAIHVSACSLCKLVKWCLNGKYQRIKNKNRKFSLIEHFSRLIWLYYWKYLELAWWRELKHTAEWNEKIFTSKRKIIHGKMNILIYIYSAENMFSSSVI